MSAILTYQSQQYLPVALGGATVNFGTLAVGASASDRIIVVAVMYNSAGSRNVSSATVGSNPATLDYADATGGGTGTALAHIADSSGNTSLNVTVVFNFGPDDAAVFVYTLNGAIGAPSAASEQYSVSVADPQKPAAAITVPVGGVGLTFGSYDLGGSATNTPLPVASWDSGTNFGGHDTTNPGTGSDGLAIWSGTAKAAGSWQPAVTGTTTSGFGSGFGFSNVGLRAVAWGPSASAPNLRTLMGVGLRDNLMDKINGMWRRRPRLIMPGEPEFAF